MLACPRNTECKASLRPLWWQGFRARTRQGSHPERHAQNPSKPPRSGHAHADREKAETHSSFEFTRENVRVERCFDVVLLVQREAKPVFNCKAKWFLHGPCLWRLVAFTAPSPATDTRPGLPALSWSTVTFEMRSPAGIFKGGGVNLSEMSL